MKFDQIFAGALLVGLFAVLLILAFVQIPEKNMTLFASLASGVVGAGIGTYIGFRWGSAAPPPAGSAAPASPPQAPGA